MLSNKIFLYSVLFFLKSQRTQIRYFQCRFTQHFALFYNCHDCVAAVDVFMALQSVLLFFSASQSTQTVVVDSAWVEISSTLAINCYSIPLLTQKCGHFLCSQLANSLKFNIQMTLQQVRTLEHYPYTYNGI